MKRKFTSRLLALAVVAAFIPACNKAPSISEQKPEDKSESFIVEGQKITATGSYEKEGRTYVTWETPSAYGQVMLPKGTRIIKDSESQQARSSDAEVIVVQNKK